MASSPLGEGDELRDRHARRFRLSARCNADVRDRGRSRRDLTRVFSRQRRDRGRGQRRFGARCASGMRTDVEPDSLPYDPELRSTRSPSDGFRPLRGAAGRRLALSRALRRRTRRAYRELPSEVQPYYRELSSHGELGPTRTSTATCLAAHRRGLGLASVPRRILGATDPAGTSGSLTSPGAGRRTTTGAGAGSDGRTAGAGARAAIFAGAWVSWSWGSTCTSGWSPLELLELPRLSLDAGTTATTIRSAGLSSATTTSTTTTTPTTASPGIT